MYKIVIVDDEVRQCRGLKNILSRQFEQFEIKDFTNGEKALSYIMEEDIKIVITDICMPNMDGLELTRRMKEKDRNIKIILLTGFADFEYARKALSLGAFDYLLKPVNPDKLRETLEKAMHELDAESILSKKHNQMQKQLDMTLPVYMENLMNQWVYGWASPDERKEIDKIISPRQAGFVIAVKFEGLLFWQKGKDKEEIKEGKSQLIWWMRSLLRKQYHTMSFFSHIIPETMITIVICKESMQRTDECFISKNLSGSFLKADLFGEEGCKLNMKAGLSRMSPNISDDITECYKKAIEVLKYSFYFPELQVLYGEEILVHVGKKIGITMAEEALLKEAVIQEDDNRAFDILESLMKQYVSNKYPEPDHFIHTFENLLYHIETSLQIDSKMDDWNRECFSSFLESGKEYLKHMIQELQIKKEWKKTGFTAEFDKYIEEHYKEDISLDCIAEKFHLTPAYFSGVIKETTGKSFSKSLIEVRTNHAKELLRNTDLRIYEIAEETGYHDVKYFNRVFKKSVGITPIEYRGEVKGMGKGV